jgi:hypothetical protein
LREIWAGQQETTIAIEAINDRLAAERRDLKMPSDQVLAQTSGKKTINDSLAAEDQFTVLAARLSALQNAMTRILRDNAELAERLKVTQAQMAQDNASVAEQLKALTQMMARRLGVLAMGSEERERRLATTGSTAAAPAATRSRTAHRKNHTRRADGSSGAAGRSLASPAPTARSPSPLPPSPALR